MSFDYSLISLFALFKFPDEKPGDLAQKLLEKRKVRKNLHLQYNTAAFREIYLSELKSKTSNCNEKAFASRTSEEENGK
jgi:hypothetical protein